MANDSCKDCEVRKALIDLATVARNVLDGTLRYTWSEKAMYMNQVDKIIKSLKPPVEEST